MASHNLMPSQDEITKNAKAQDKPQDDSAQAAKPAEDKRELTDDEIAAVAGAGVPHGRLI